MTLPRQGWLVVVLPLAVLSAGCSMTPKSFRSICDPAALTRARSVGLGDGRPRTEVIPALIDRLEDQDRVVRLAAYEELRRTTGKTFGYRPWAGESERITAVRKWRAWWNESRAGLVRSVSTR